MANFFRAVNEYKIYAEERANNLSGLLSAQISMASKPHNTSSYHISSVFYPLCNTLKTLNSAAKIIEGGILFTASLFIDRNLSLPVLFGVAFEFNNLLLNIANVVTSVVSLFTRTLATFISGYTHAARNELDNPIYQASTGLAP